ncbi:nitroreductase [Sulfolobus acidocaldarius]|uniref:Conserved Archaeal membrane protein n=4 Tax=Sulfolobus acidocaldarius TaxID=2285 RepID=Q4JBA4_SULAC|nr:conserved Archaeal membrane protein [Sulfolobus acidocaldarius DSM 639]AGE70493.1 hypothetical protein SacN8_02575 [Sulfolobus acidocaldarius N8]AGE72766.1 hypothetical protein SacRon12I_02565 [Sulfolobus acidocaldarius Ron12/I]ALU30555.1 nitroreductase [Sulfolobus acidocaldarius]ALU32819.1 nitroreductase [Sulfolobus acidocaldarius]
MNPFERFYLDTQIFNFTLLPNSLPKKYGNVKKIPLPTPIEINVSFQEVMKRRHSSRAFRRERINLNKISSLLWYSVGVKEIENGIQFRMFPSAGNLAETEVYLISLYTDLEKGVYHYDPVEGSLDVLSNDLDEELMLQAIKNSLPDITFVPLIILLTSLYWKPMVKYGNRGARFSLIDTGIVIENFYLVATALGLGISAIGGFNDDFFNKLIGVGMEKGEVVIGMLVVGEE